jgi:site-specific recombinase XerC
LWANFERGCALSSLPTENAVAYRTFLSPPYPSLALSETAAATHFARVAALRRRPVGALGRARPVCAQRHVPLAHRQAPRLHGKRAKLMTTALRSFLNYARYCGQVAVDLAAAVPVVPHWPMTTIPRAISPDQVRQLLTSIDRGTGIGRRDYAILLLLARLGLRSGEGHAVVSERIPGADA